jgi:SPP1 family predicted phage head-tail adaptor
MNNGQQISASDLNRLVTLESYTYSTNSAGGIAAVLADSLVDIWANVKPLNGGNVINQGQDKNFAYFEITIRYRPQVTENWTINYNGQTLKIKQMQVDDESYKRYLIIYASTTLQQQSWS